MQSLDRINEFVSLVCQQIRWRKAHTRVEEEMRNHIIDQRDSYIAQGIDEKEATEKAITDTGDATMIGSQLDRTHRPKPQWGMLAVTVVLMSIGLLIRLFVFNEDRSGLLSIAMGMIVMFAAYFSDFTLFGKYPKTVYISVILLSIVTLCFSPVINGRSFYAQYFVLLFPLAFSAVVFAARNKGYLGIIICGLAFAFPAFIAICVPSITGSMLFCVSGITILIVAIHRNWFGIKRAYGYLMLLAPVIILAVLFFMFMNAYRWNRLAVALNPSLDPNGAGYMGTLTRELLRGAKLFGMGSVPEQYSIILREPFNLFRTDLMLTAVTALLGWIAFAVIIVVLLFFIIKGFQLCIKQKSSLGLFVSLAIMMTFTIQAIGYVIFNLGFQLFSPLSLPLISFGNVATVINLGLIGFMLSVFRTGDIVEDGKMPYQNSKSFSWQIGKLTISIKE